MQGRIISWGMRGGLYTMREWETAGVEISRKQITYRENKLKHLIVSDFLVTIIGI